ncbi:MAG: 3'(2'),5'-bisphosphate nucleotidase CysQ [Sedimentisphaerales bacterium]|nr:3'(2'),5'-bisphosphate nucleotidase CysQ [Sedimentisphaerales bacterium]
MDNLVESLEVLKKYVYQAGQAIFQMATEGFETAYKAHKDPVTTADIKADSILREGLLKDFPDTGWLSEETRDDYSRLEKKLVWIVDPIDGTKEFVGGIPEYAVSVALVEEGLPILAAVYNPATKELFTAASGQGAWLNDEIINSEHELAAKPLILASRSEIKRGEFKPFELFAQIKPCGSIAYKLALVAAGMADTTFSLGPKNEWDIAAGVLLVRESGGNATNRIGTPFIFNQRATLVNGIVATTKHAFRPVTTLIEQITSNKHHLT